MSAGEGGGGAARCLRAAGPCGRLQAGEHLGTVVDHHVPPLREPHGGRVRVAAVLQEAVDGITAGMDALEVAG